MAVVPDHSCRDQPFALVFGRKFPETAVETPFNEIGLRSFQAKLLFTDKRGVYKLIVFCDEKKDLARHYRISRGF